MEALIINRSKLEASDKTPFSKNWIERTKYEFLISDMKPIINLVPIGKYKTGRDRSLDCQISRWNDRQAICNVL